MILQDVENMYETDQVRPVIDRAAALSGREYTSAESAEDPHHTDDVRMRVVADHSRPRRSSIGDGVTPCNEGRGYVLRRLLRRVIRSSAARRRTGLPAELMAAFRDAMKGVYPNWSPTSTASAGSRWPRRTRSTARWPPAPPPRGRRNESKAASQPLSGADAFALHDTYGFPIDLTLEMAAEAGLKVDELEFRELMPNSASAPRPTPGQEGVARRPQRVPGAAVRR